jgi:hypothetical protein
MLQYLLWPVRCRSQRNGDNGKKPPWKNPAKTDFFDFAAAHAPADILSSQEKIVAHTS